MFLAWGGVGLFMLLAPARFGNLVHDSLLLFPRSWFQGLGKKLGVRLAGVGLIAFAIRFALGVAKSVR